MEFEDLDAKKFENNNAITNPQSNIPLQKVI